MFVLVPGAASRHWAATLFQEASMARSTCAKCGNTSFEIMGNEPSGAKFKHFFVQCGKCGVVVGVQEYFNAGSILTKIAKALNVPI